MEPKSDDTNLSLEEFDKNLPHTVTLLRGPNGARVYLVGTGHFSVESQNDVSKVNYERTVRYYSIVIWILLLCSGYFSKQVMQAVKPHILVVELCTDRASVMQMDEEAILKEARDFSYGMSTWYVQWKFDNAIVVFSIKFAINNFRSAEKLKSIFKEAGVLQGVIYVLLLKLSASLTENHGIAPGGEFRRALKEVRDLNTICSSMFSTYDFIEEQIYSV